MPSCVGLIGGLAVGASCEYYKRLVGAMRAENAPLHLVLVHADLARVVAYMSGGQTEALAEYQASLIRQLHAAGATHGVITSVASHYAFDEVTRLSPLPLISILQAIREGIEAKQLKRVGLFGSRFSVQSDLYGALQGVTEVARPSDEEIHSVNQLYMGLAERGFANPDDESKLTALAETILKRESLDAVILAGTDFAVLYNDDHRPSFPYLDSTDLHVQAIVRQLTQ